MPDFRTNGMKRLLLTSLELKVMNSLWDKEKAFVKDLVSEWPEERKPAYNTVSTIIRILEEKGFVGHQVVGRSHLYFPRIARSKYRKSSFRSLLEEVFDGSLTNLVSTIVDDKELSREEIEKLRKLLENRASK